MFISKLSSIIINLKAKKTMYTHKIMILLVLLLQSYNMKSHLLDKLRKNR